MAGQWMAILAGAVVVRSQVARTGEDEFLGGRVDPGFRFSPAHTVTDRFSPGCNTGDEWASERGEYGSRERIGAFVEICGGVPGEWFAGAGLSKRWLK